MSAKRETGKTDKNLKPGQELLNKLVCIKRRLHLIDVSAKSYFFCRAISYECAPESCMAIVSITIEDVLGYP